jgi:pSer/pThr/pTyr-binding forkhead associated (FHA) protein
MPSRPAGSTPGSSPSAAAALKRTSASIGRSKEADVRIEDRYASSIHARLFERGGRFFVEDMSSTNGTLLNGATLKGEAELIDGDTVQIGDTVFRLEAS